VKYFCAACGRPVPVDGETVGRCSQHPNALRYSQSWAGRAFEAMHKACREADGIGRVFHTTRNYWTVMESRAIKGGAL